MNERVWDMVLHLAHPGFLYVVFQVIILTRFSAHPVVRQYDLFIYVGQLLGAWTVFYTTLLRDMGLKSRAGTFLALLAMVGAVASHFLVTNPYHASDKFIVGFLLVQLIPAALLWIWTMIYWRREKARHMAEQDT
jgi:cadmium resistance protein CadD (predicted permease)